MHTVIETPTYLADAKSAGVIDDAPVLLLRLISKGQRSDIAQSDRNALRQILPLFAEAYRRRKTDPESR